MVFIIICKDCEKNKPAWKGKLCHECYLAYAKKWRKKKKRLIRHRVANEKCKDKNPAMWSTKTLVFKGIVRHHVFPGDLAKMEEIYKKARSLTRSTGIRYSVDHIVPLQGVNVCGLHASWNLQVMKLSDNIAKGNKHE